LRISSVSEFMTLYRYINSIIIIIIIIEYHLTVNLLKRIVRLFISSIYLVNTVGDKPTGRQPTGRHIFANWTTEVETHRVSVEAPHLPHLHSASNSYEYTSTTINGLYRTIIYQKLMISNILPTFTSLITVPMLSPSWPKCVAQLAVAQLDCSQCCLSPIRFVGQMTVHRLYDRSGDGKHCHKTAWGCIVLAYSVIASFTHSYRKRFTWHLVLSELQGHVTMLGIRAGDSNETPPIDLFLLYCVRRPTVFSRFLVCQSHKPMQRSTL